MNQMIDLNRTFSKVEARNEDQDDSDIATWFERSEKQTWTSLLPAYRVVILSEAGSGKTTELKQQAAELNRQGKPAFFVRLEHLIDRIELAFDWGDYHRFLVWLAGSEEGWLLLDSVDESRIRSPRDFEVAIRNLANQLHPARQRVHLVISARPSAWRTKDDKALVDVLFRPDPGPSDEKKTTTPDSTSLPENVDEDPMEIKFFRLDALTLSQVRQLLELQKVSEPESLLQEVERKDASHLLWTPQDIDELVAHWNNHGTIGSPLEMVRASVDRLLSDANPDRSISQKPLIDIRKAVKRLAAACTLGKESAIQLPNAVSVVGVDPAQVLVDWLARDIEGLLGCPLFDADRLGTVRFRHQRFREYLTAEWFHSLLEANAPHPRIERLFFTEQYGESVVVPRLRPILPWLVLLNQRFLRKTWQVAPECLIEDGDPSQLPLELREELVRDACRSHNKPGRHRAYLWPERIQRLAASDLGPVISEQLEAHREDMSIVGFLMLLLWRSGISDLRDAAESVAFTSTEKYTRAWAIRVLFTLSTQDQFDIARGKLLNTVDTVDPLWLDELLQGSTMTASQRDWLIKALEKTPTPDQFDTDTQAQILTSRVAEDWPLENLVPLCIDLGSLLIQPPLIEIDDTGVSERYEWLGLVVLSILNRLVDSKHPCVLTDLLHHFDLIQHSNQYSMRDAQQQLRHLSESIRHWPELNHALFWSNANRVKAEMLGKGQVLTRSGNVCLIGSLWEYSSDCVDLFITDLRERSDFNDRLLALDVLAVLPDIPDAPADVGQKIDTATAKDSNLLQAMEEIQQRNSQKRKHFELHDKRYEEQKQKRHDQELDGKRRRAEFFQGQLHALRHSENADELSQAQCQLIHYLRLKGGDNQFSVLVEEFGEEVAIAFREGAVRFWRNHTAQLSSEGSDPKKIYWSNEFGLLGLMLESDSQDRWAAGLTLDLARKASRFAMHQLNGFPYWLESIYQAFPTEVIEVVMLEIAYELSRAERNTLSHGTFSTVVQTGQWLWEGLSPQLADLLGRAYRDITAIRSLLTILLKFESTRPTISQIASRSAAKTIDVHKSGIWYAAWLLTDPDRAFNSLSKKLVRLPAMAQKTELSMVVVTQLFGHHDRLSGWYRENTLNVHHLGNLAVLMHQYISLEEDNDRSGGKPFTPDMRDDAERSRDAIIHYIIQKGGRDAYNVLKDLSRRLPSPMVCAWMVKNAYDVATNEADLSVKSASDILTLADRFEAPPANQRELSELILDRLHELKSDLEDGDESPAPEWKTLVEEKLRKNVTRWLRERSSNMYTCAQEDELADESRPDIRIWAKGIDGPVPIEIKIAENWSGPVLIKGITNQLVGYLRDRRSRYGVFLLISCGNPDKRSSWSLTSRTRVNNIESLVKALQAHWHEVSFNFPGIEDVRVVGIDLTKRTGNS